MLIQMNFSQIVAQYFKDKMINGVKTFLFDELPNNPIHDVYLNIVLIKLLTEIRGKDTTNIKFPYNLKDPFLIGEESFKPLLACFPPVKTKKINTLSPNLHSNEENIITIDEQSSSFTNSSSDSLQSQWKNLFNKQKHSKPLIDVQNEKPSILLNKKQNEPPTSLIVISDENHNAIGENIIYEIKVNQHQIMSLLDSDFRLPEFSPRIEDALNDEDECIDILPEMSQELASFLMSNGFYSLSHNEYKALTEKLLYKYDILYGILNRKVETDYINEVVRYKQKPESILQAYISSELIRCRNNEKRMIKVDQNNNHVKRFSLAEKKTITDYFNTSKQNKSFALSKWLNDSSEALCDLS